MKKVIDNIFAGTCTNCGSNDTSCISQEYPEIIYSCLSCGKTFSFDRDDDEAYNKVVDTILAIREKKKRRFKKL